MESTLRQRHARTRTENENNGANENTSRDDHKVDQIAATSADEKKTTEAEKPSQSWWWTRFRQYMAKPRGKRRHSFVFLLGGLFGVFVALFFANQNEVINLDVLADLNLDALIDVMPQGFISDALAFTVWVSPP